MFFRPLVNYGAAAGWPWLLVLGFRHYSSRLVEQLGMGAWQMQNISTPRVGRRDQTTRDRQVVVTCSSSAMLLAVVQIRHPFRFQIQILAWIYYYY
jgi:hypothetical protein